MTLSDLRDDLPLFDDRMIKALHWCVSVALTHHPVGEEPADLMDIWRLLSREMMTRGLLPANEDR